MISKETEIKVEPPGSISGSIGREWEVSGVTQFSGPDLRTAKIEVGVTAMTEEWVKKVARCHEEGHVATAQDIVDALGHSEEAMGALMASDRWNNEVESWLRVFEFPPESFGEARVSRRHIMSQLETFHFVMDCLNSYRRGLSRPQSDWDELVELLVDRYMGDAGDIRDYVPLEPDPNEEPAQGCILIIQDGDQDDDQDEDGQSEDGDQDDDHGGEQPSDSGDQPDEQFDDRRPPEKRSDPPKDDSEDDSEDASEEKSSEGETEDEGKGGEEDPKTTGTGVLQMGWLKQDILDALRAGEAIESVATREGLDPSRAPALVQVVAHIHGGSR